MAVVPIHTDRSRPSRCAGLDARQARIIRPATKQRVTNLGRAAAFCRHRSLNASLFRMSPADPAPPSPNSLAVFTPSFRMFLSKTQFQGQFRPRLRIIRRNHRIGGR